MAKIGRMKDALAFDKRSTIKDAFGGESEIYTEQFSQACELIHMSGSESVDSARLAGREVYKARLRSSEQLRAVTSAGWQVRDTRRGKTYNITSIDAVTDRAQVWIILEA